MEYVPWASSSDDAYSYWSQASDSSLQQLKLWVPGSAYMCCMWPGYLLQGWIAGRGSDGGVPKGERKKILFPESAVKILLLYFESSGLWLLRLQLFKDVINISDILLNAVCFDYQTLLEYHTQGGNDNIDLPMYSV